MTSLQLLQLSVPGSRISILPLENGEQLRSPAFLRRFEAMPDVQKAELVDGTVFLSLHVRADHGEADGLMQGWLGYFAMLHDEMKFYSNSTLLLDAENTVQPDCMLCSAPREGGVVWLNEKGYLCGAPELVCEVAASTTWLDLHQKFRAYCRNGIAEYLVWLTVEGRFLWFVLEDAEYVAMEQDAAGFLKSRRFPGLVLDTKAALKGQAAKVIAGLTAAGKR